MKKLIIFITLLFTWMLISDADVGLGSAHRRYPDGLMRFIVTNTNDSLLSVPEDSLKMWLRNEGFTDTLSLTDSITAITARLKADYEQAILDSTTALLNRDTVIVENNLKVKQKLTFGDVKFEQNGAGGFWIYDLDYLTVWGNLQTGDGANIESDGQLTAEDSIKTKKSLIVANNAEIRDSTKTAELYLTEGNSRITFGSGGKIYQETYTGGGFGGLTEQMTISDIAELYVNSHFEVEGKTTLNNRLRGTYADIDTVKTDSLNAGKSRFTGTVRFDDHITLPSENTYYSLANATISQTANELTLAGDRFNLRSQFHPNPYSATSPETSLFIGVGAGRTGASGASNTVVGSLAGSALTTGNLNTFNGESSGRLNTTGFRNTFNGYASGFSNTTGFRNTFNGNSSGYSNTTGYQNTFNGNLSGNSNTTGYQNTFNGNASGRNNTTGNNNTALADSSGWQNTTGSNNLFLGKNASNPNANDSYKLVIAQKISNANAGLLVSGDFAAGITTIHSVLTLNPLATASRPASPTAGMIYFDDTEKVLKMYNGTAWYSLDMTIEP